MSARVFRHPAARFLIFFICVVALQAYSRAFESATRAMNPDEPAHIVTGLMAHDYLTKGLGQPPMQFARTFYIHYPKVALGHWPPMFYVDQALWMLVFPTTRTSLLLLIASLTALIATILFPVIEREYGAMTAWCACLVMLSTPGMLENSTQIMTEIPQAVFLTSAMLSFGAFLDSGRWRDSALFGVWSAASLLTKGTGLALVAVPVFSIVLSARWALLKKWQFWIPAPIVLLLSGPWYKLAPFALHQRVAAYGAPGFHYRRLKLPPMIWVQEFGWAVAIFVLAGLVAVLFKRAPKPGVWTSAAALVISATLFPVFFGAWELRHQSESAAAFILIALVGVLWVRSALPRLVDLQAIWLPAFSALLIVWNVANAYRQEPSPYRTLAQEILRSQDRAVFITANATAEGALISEVAQRDTRPGRFVLRGTKLLADMDWAGYHERERFHNSAELSSFLAKLPVDLIVIDENDPPPFPYFALLKDTIAMNQDMWRPAEAFTSAPGVRIYRKTGAHPVSSEERDQMLAAVGGPPSQ